MAAALPTLVVALRGAAAILVLTTLIGGIPRLVQAGLAIVIGAWCAIVVGAPAQLAEVAWLAAPRELAIGATLGLIAALPLLAVATAGRLVDLASGARTQGPYAALFGVLGAAVFVGIDGHVAVVTAIATSFHGVPAAAATSAVSASADGGAIAALGALIPNAVHLAIPWLVTAAVVELAAGVGNRLAARTTTLPLHAATPAALMMMTATLIGTLAVAIARLVR